MDVIRNYKGTEILTKDSLPNTPYTPELGIRYIQLGTITVRSNGLYSP